MLADTITAEEAHTMIKYPAGTIVRILPAESGARVELEPLATQRGTPTVKAGSTWVVTVDSPCPKQGGLVVLGLASGWAGATEAQIEVVYERRKLAARADWTLTPPTAPGEWEPYAYLVGGGDGWDLCWVPKGCESPGEAETYGHHHIEWPFGPDDIAEVEDFARLGFRVET